MNEYWKILLKRQQERGKKGFTLPFLIGSQTYLPSPHKHQTIRDIIVDMASNNKFETCIRYCMDTSALIFEIKNPTNKVAYPNFENNEQKNLSVAFLNNNLGNSVEEIIESMEQEYQDKINRGQYSAKSNSDSREANWTGFAALEIEFITECFKIE